MNKYKAGDKVVLEVLSIDGDGYYIVGSEHYSWWASPKNLDEVIEPLSTYTAPLNDKIKIQEEEITRLLTENAELKKKYEGLNKALNDFNDIVSESARAAGQHEAWELARKIVYSIYNGGYDLSELDEIFGYHSPNKILKENNYIEAAAKIEEWERQKEICVGDVVICNGKHGIVTCVSACLKGIVENGNVFCWSKEECTKTDGHIDVSAMLKQIGGDDNEN